MPHELMTGENTVPRSTQAGPKVNNRRSLQQLGPIRDDELYPLPVLKQRLGLGDAAMRRLRRDGVKIRRIGNLHCALGREVIEFIENHT